MLGIALGTLPIAFPGLPQPIRLGLAGGPLIVALILGRIGRIGRQVWHMPTNTNLAFREFGIALFFAAVGLGAGAKFFATVFSATGLYWLLAGFCVTVLPILLVGIFARAVWKMNFMDLSGFIAGSMTDPPALAFACNIARSDAPTVGYATVYPLTTLLAHSFRAGPRDFSFPMNTPTLGEARFASTKNHTTDDDIRIPERIEIGAEPGISFELAGPRAKLFFDSKQTRAGIVTCGGLCPGLNNVIRSLFLELHYGYGVAEVLGFRGGYSGLDPDCATEPVVITPSSLTAFTRMAVPSSARRVDPWILAGPWTI